MKSGSISIIIPTHNRMNLLREALAGICEGNLDPFDCVVVDDSSEDQTLEMIDLMNHEAGKGRIVTVVQPSRMGAQAARNRGIQEASGDYLLFMDSDDMPNPEGILRLRDCLESRADLDYCYGRVQKVDATLKPFSGASSVGEVFGDAPREIAGYHWHTMGALYRRSCVDIVGGWNLDLHGSQDWEYQARVKLSGAKGQFMDVLVGYWRQHDGVRVGASQFRQDYVRSVMLACESVVSLARTADRCDGDLEQRIAKKLMLHALEWGAHGYHAERKECFFQAATTVTRNLSLRLMAHLLARLPAFADSWLLRKLTRHSE